MGAVLALAIDADHGFDSPAFPVHSGMVVAHCRCILPNSRQRIGETHSVPGPSVGQLVGQLVVLFVDPFTDLLRLDPVESRGQLLLILSRQELVGHREEDAVLFGDVRTQELNKTKEIFPDGGDRCGIAVVGWRKCIGHGAHPLPSQIVFVEHGRQGAALEGHAAPVHLDKEELFLLGVVAAVCKVPKEIDHLFHALGTKLTLLHQLGFAFGCVQDYEDDLMFVFERFRRCHRPSLFVPRLWHYPFIRITLSEFYHACGIRGMIKIIGGIGAWGRRASSNAGRPAQGDAGLLQNLPAGNQLGIDRLLRRKTCSRYKHPELV
jgi:hypothetical protein